MAKKICRNCGYYGRPSKTSSFIGELFVWGIFIFLAIFFFWTIFVPIICISICMTYTLYRFFAGTKTVCPSCKAINTMISADSPVGKELYERYHKNPETQDNN